MSDTTELTIGEHVYRIGRISAWKSLHVYRRLLPILSSLVERVKENSALTAKPSDEAAFLTGLSAMGDAISEMKDEDVDYVVRECLRVCARRQGDAWAPMLSGAGHLMMEDVDLSELLQLTSATLQSQEGLQAFFTRVADSSGQPASAQDTTS